jgi:hypothetical protein
VTLYVTLQRTFSRGPSEGFIAPMRDHVPAKLSNTGSAHNGLTPMSTRQAAPMPMRPAENFNSIEPILIREVWARPGPEWPRDVDEDV